MAAGNGAGRARCRARAGRWRGARCASPRRRRRSGTWRSSPTWPRYGNGCGRNSIPPPEGEDLPTCLNLFGYTGVGSLALAAAGARVVHVDASKKSVDAAKANAKASGLADAPVRWLVDDAAKFVAREVRRGRRYDGILLDPPKYGRGPEGEVWRLEEHLAGLVADARRLLDERSRFLFLTVYAVRMSALSIGELLRQAFADLPGEVEAGELGVREEARGLVLPTAIWARWSIQRRSIKVM